MNTNLTQGSARIYQFPAGGRAALGGRRSEVATSIGNSVLGGIHAGCGEAWYHEEAIREAQAKREH